MGGGVSGSAGAWRVQYRRGCQAWLRCSGGVPGVSLSRRPPRRLDGQCVMTVISGAVIRLSVWLPADPHARVLARGACAGGWVGCGPYSGRSRSYLFHSPPGVGVVVVCVGLLVPVSSQTAAGLPLLAYQPSSLLGAYQNTKGVLWRPYLEDGFPLICFQRLPSPNEDNTP